MQHEETDCSSRNEDIAMMVAQQPDTKRSKVLVCAISALLTIVVCFFAYIVATMPNRKECQLCTESNTVFPGLVWYTTWCLITTSTTWAIYVWRRFFSSHSSNNSSTASSKSNIPELFRLSLPMSVTVSLAYTFYLVTNDWGRDMVDDEICYTMSTSAIPKEGTSRATAITFLTLDRLANLTNHYLCAAINFTLYFKSYKQGDWQPLTPLCFIIVQSILIVLVHEFVDEVYCTDNIILDCALTIILFGVLHLVFFCRKRRTTTS